MERAQNSAETIGLKAVSWLVGNEDLLPLFLGASGASEQDFRTSLTDPAFQGGVLDFILMDDAWVQSFCEAHALAPEVPFQARQMLPGGEQVNWT